MNSSSGKSLNPRRFYKNGNAFSTGHYLLPKHKYMIDIDRLRLRAEMSISKENTFFAEYAIESNQELIIQAVFSLKHKQTLLKQDSPALDFIHDLQNRVLRAIARKLEARLFVVFHCDNEEPPFDIHEVDVKSGAVVRRAQIAGQTKEAWTAAWKELRLL